MTIRILLPSGFVLGRSIKGAESLQQRLSVWHWFVNSWQGQGLDSVMLVGPFQHRIFCDSLRLPHRTWGFCALGVFSLAVVPKLPSQSKDKSWIFEGMTHEMHFKHLLSNEGHCSPGLPVPVYSHKNFEGHSNVDVGNGRLNLTLESKFARCPLFTGMVACTWTADGRTINVMGARKEEIPMVFCW